eukprot:363506-Chlamydomonas_euryale.AAC.7
MHQRIVCKAVQASPKQLEAPPPGGLACCSAYDIAIVSGVSMPPTLAFAHCSSMRTPTEHDDTAVHHQDHTATPLPASLPLLLRSLLANRQLSGLEFPHAPWCWNASFSEGSSSTAPLRDSTAPSVGPDPRALPPSARSSSREPRCRWLPYAKARRRGRLGGRRGSHRRWHNVSWRQSCGAHLWGGRSSCGCRNRRSRRGVQLVEALQGGGHPGVNCSVRRAAVAQLSLQQRR